MKIIYTSDTGHTAQYAKILGEKTGLPVYELGKSDKHLKKGEEIIYLGWLFANNVKGYKKAFKKYTVSAVCAVGLCDTGTAIAEVRRINSIPESIPLFTMQGGMDKTKLRGVEKFMIRMLTKAVDSKKEKSDDDARMLYLLKNDKNYVSEENTAACMAWYASLSEKNKAMTLETKRLVLRPWREEDAEDLYTYASDPEVGPPAGWPPHTSAENSREIIRTVLSVPETYAVCLKEDGAAIGSIGLKMGAATDMTDRDDECELGYWIGKPFWGRGLIPEAARELLRHAFEYLGMRAVWCGYYDGNTKSRRVQEKLGFVYHHTTEGLAVPLVNEIRTGHVMLMTKETWENIK